MDNEDWNKFVKVFNLDVDVTVKKEVTRADVILSLLNDDEIAFKSKNGTFLIKIDERYTLDMIRQLILNPVENHLEYLKELNQPRKEKIKWKT